MNKTKIWLWLCLCLFFGLFGSLLGHKIESQNFKGLEAISSKKVYNEYERKYLNYQYEILRYYIGGKSIRLDDREVLDELAMVGFIKYGLDINKGIGTACTTPFAISIFPDRLL